MSITYNVYHVGKFNSSHSDLNTSSAQREINEMDNDATFYMYNCGYTITDSKIKKTRLVCTLTDAVYMRHR